MITHPGVYCLRTNVEDRDEETLWRTYTSLTDARRCSAPSSPNSACAPFAPRGAPTGICSSPIAYQLVQTIRRRLGEQGEYASSSLRRILDGQQRVTATFRRDGRLHVRKATRAEPRQQEIYRALGIDPAPGGIRKTIV